MKFAKKIKNARKKLNLSHVDLAYHSKVSPATIRNWEDGKTKPNHLELIGLEKYLKCKF